MARTASETTATRRANAKSNADVKAKRKPSAYNLFVKEHMKTYLAEHPGKTNKDAMKHIGAIWKDAPENPRRGQEAKEKVPKAAKRSKRAATKASEVDEGPEVEPGSDE